MHGAPLDHGMGCHLEGMRVHGLSIEESARWTDVRAALLQSAVVLPVGGVYRVSPGLLGLMETEDLASERGRRGDASPTSTGARRPCSWASQVALSRRAQP